MAKKFNLGDYFDVSELNTSGEEIVDIPIEKLTADERNFYKLSNLEELADNIRFCGLQQPVRVREGDAPGEYIIISGHRRTEAIRLLSEEDEKWNTVPCIIDHAGGSAAMQELRLILANSDTRDLTSYEINEQAKRVQELFVQLKGEGVQFEGRMRDRVAEACKVSASKLARLSAIDNNLKVEEARVAYKDGDLNESAAYEMSKLPTEVQTIICDYIAEKPERSFRNLYGSSLTNLVETLEKVEAPDSCPDGGKCTFGKAARVEAVTQIAVRDVYWSKPSCVSSCCLNCKSLETCKRSCAKSEAKKRELKANTAANKRAEKEKTLAEEDRKGRLMADIWERFGLLRAAEGLDWDEFKTMSYNRYSAKEVAEFEQGKGIKPFMMSPYGVSYDDIARLRKAARMLRCSIDALVGSIPGEDDAE